MRLADGNSTIRCGVFVALLLCSLVFSLSVTKKGTSYRITLGRWMVLYALNAK